MSTLSEGNRQKGVIGKWLATDPDILVLDEPTAGIGMISSELSELVTACDRILVMADGRAHQMIDRATLNDPAQHDPAHRLQGA